jgi:hypothetical protein
MKYKVGDILRSADNMTIIDLDECDQEVYKGEYFIVVSHGIHEYADDIQTRMGYKLLSQKSGTCSFWEEEEAPLSESFNKG